MRFQLVLLDTNQQGVIVANAHLTTAFPSAYEFFDQQPDGKQQFLLLISVTSTKRNLDAQL